MCVAVMIEPVLRSGGTCRNGVLLFLSQKQENKIYCEPSRYTSHSPEPESRDQSAQRSTDAQKLANPRVWLEHCRGWSIDYLSGVTPNIASRRDARPSVLRRCILSYWAGLHASRASRNA